MNQYQNETWFKILSSKAQELYPNSDPAHDFLHVQRVVQMAYRLCQLENANWNVVMPAAFLHDFINVPKNDPRRKIASRLSAEAATEYLKSINYPLEYLADVEHAIEAHSYSANKQPKTLEAKILQDADRLDSLGAIGVARLFATSTLMTRPFYNEQDPWAKSRVLDDKSFAIDHFYTKILKLVDLLNTTAAQEEGAKRLTFVKTYLEQLKQEI